MTTAIHNVRRLGDEARLEGTYQRLLPELQILDSTERVPIDQDLGEVVTTALGVIARLRPYRTELVEQLPHFDLSRFDKLKDYALALRYAHHMHTCAMQPPHALDALYEEAVCLRETLQLDITGLVGRGVISTTTLKELKGPMGLKNVATDLQILAYVLKLNFTLVEGQSTLQPAELDRAFKLASRILRVVAGQEQTARLLAHWDDMLSRIFTQFAHAYDDARRAITFLRWRENDADLIAPPLGAPPGWRNSPCEITARRTTNRIHLPRSPAFCVASA